MERVISEILYLERTQNLPLETILHTVLSKYNITPKKNELITADDSWHTEVMDYLKRQTIKGLRPKTIEQYKDILVRAFESIGKPVREITASDILLYLAYLKNMRGTSARYMNGIRVVLNGFFSWCFKSKITDTNPVDGVDRIKYVKHKVKPFTEEEVEKLRVSCEKTRYPIRNRAIIELLYSSGLRCSEVVKLDINDVDLENNEGFVRDGKGGKQGDFLFSDIASFYMKKYLETRTDNNPAMFISRNGDRFKDDSGIEYIFSNLGEIAGVKGVRPHRFRHTFIQRLIDKGMSIQDVMYAVRHANISTTEGYYMENKRRTKDTYTRLFN